MNLLEMTWGGVGSALGLTVADPCGRAGKVHLREGKVLAPRLCAKAETELRCLRGTLWVTQEGKAEDLVLKAGQKVRLRGRGKVVIQALTDASLVVADGMR